MNRLYAVCAGAALSILGACASPDPSKIAFPDTSGKALLLMKAGQAGVPYVVQLAAFNEATQEMVANPFDGFEPFDIKDPQSPHYVAILVPPGSYVFQDLSQQQSWAVCFHDATKSFAVHAGEAVFLGDYHPTINLLQLSQLAHQSGQLLAHQSSVFHYFDHIVPPQVTTPSTTSADFLAAKQYEATSMPSLHGRLQPVVYQPAKFGTGYTLFGDRVCGGYFKEKLKPAS
jgi:hypothetical protein